MGYSARPCAMAATLALPRGPLAACVAQESPSATRGRRRSRSSSSTRTTSTARSVRSPTRRARGENAPLAGGYQELVEAIDEERAKVAHSVLVDAGDWFQGTPEGTLSEGRCAVELMNAAGYDFAVAREPRVRRRARPPLGDDARPRAVPRVRAQPAAREAARRRSRTRARSRPTTSAGT